MVRVLQADLLPEEGSSFLPSEAQLAFTSQPTMAVFNAHLYGGLSRTMSDPDHAEAPPAEADFVCSKCGAQFSRADSLRRHIGGNCPQA